MAYTAQITYPIYDLNSTLFMNLVKEVLQVEMLKQRTTYSKTFLPTLVKGDDYLVNAVCDADLAPAFCAISKAIMDGTEQQFSTQQNNLNYYLISIYAIGMSNLRKITDAIYTILNDLNVKQYLFLYKNSNGDNLVSDSGKYYVKQTTNEIEAKKTTNNKDVLYGSLILQAEIAERPQFNETTPIDSIEVVHELGENNTEVTQLTNL